MDEKDKIFQQEWDMYWSAKDKNGNVVYDSIAEFYRKFIISKILLNASR